MLASEIKSLLKSKNLGGTSDLNRITPIASNPATMFPGAVPFQSQFRKLLARTLCSL
jgi:hypothetical protein